jgi:hypothetical protein
MYLCPISALPGGHFLGSIIEFFLMKNETSSSAKAMRGGSDEI